MKNKKIDIFSLIFYFTFIIVFILVAFFTITKSRNNLETKKVSPIVDYKNMINDKGQIVTKSITGHFIIFDTGEEFNYSEPINMNPNTYLISYDSNSVSNCVRTNCNFVYFNKEKNTALFTTLNSPMFGKIDKINIIEGEGEIDVIKGCSRNSKVFYTVTYDIDKKYEFSEDLSISYKGGDYNCFTPKYNLGDTIIFFKNGLTGVYLENQIIKTELLSYKYSDFPDTGEKYEWIRFK